jgi:hypothetical protein
MPLRPECMLLPCAHPCLLYTPALGNVGGNGGACAAHSGCLADVARSCVLQQPWVQELIASHRDCKLVFSADGNATAETMQHLSTGLSQDHLVSSNSLQQCVACRPHKYVHSFFPFQPVHVVHRTHVFIS